MFHCKVCNQEFSNIYDHLDEIRVGTNMPGWQVGDAKHEEAEYKASTSSWENGCPFCGGPIQTHGWKDASYEIVCQDCGYLLDED